MGSGGGRDDGKEGRVKGNWGGGGDGEWGAMVNGVEGGW